jgi:uncharacterized FlgJ-related protein
MRITLMFIGIAISVSVIASFGESKNLVKAKKKIMIEDTTEVIPVVDSTKITKDMLVEYILQSKITHPEIAYSIIMTESGMCSKLFKSNNNLFGMRQPGVRPTMSKGPKYGFASFEKWQHSVLDYKLYLEFVGGHKMTRDSYLSHLDRNYAHKGYSSYISKFFDEFYSYVNN